MRGDVAEFNVIVEGELIDRLKTIKIPVALITNACLIQHPAEHPIREDAVLELLHKTNSNEDIVYLLIEGKLLEKVKYSGHNYYLRKFKN